MSQNVFKRETDWIETEFVKEQTESGSQKKQKNIQK